MHARTSRQPMPAVDVECDAGDAVCQFGCEEDDRSGDVLGRDDATERRLRVQVLSDLVDRLALLLGLPLEVDVQVRPFDPSGQHGVDAYPAAAFLDGECADQ